MEPRTLQYMAAAAEGRCVFGAPDSLVERVCTDSRHVRPGDLFVALRGDRFDGHAFLKEVVTKGARALLVEDSELSRILDSPGSGPGLPEHGVIAVDNSRRGFGRMAARYRQDFTLPLVAIGGSNGKTSTKDLLAAVLRQRFKLLASPASFNNDIGVPTTLLDLAREHQVAVLEFGTNHPGELAPLLKIARPLYGVITSIGREHLEFFGDLAGVLQEEGTLAEMLPREGKLFLNGDTTGAAEIRHRSAAPVVSVGLGAGNSWRATDVRMGLNGVTFRVDTGLAPDFCTEFRLPLLGRHQVVNALLVMAVAAELNLRPDEVQQGFAACVPSRMRLQLWTWRGVHVLDDSYNANADSMRAALDTLAAMPCVGRRVAVLGEMAELGNHAPSAHAEIGRYAAGSGVDYLFTIGAMGSLLAAAARESGLRNVEEHKDVAPAAESLKQHLKPGDILLLKGSRAAAVERVGELLKKEPGD